MAGKKLRSFPNPFKFIKQAEKLKIIEAKEHEGFIRFVPDFGSSANKVVIIYDPMCMIDEEGSYEVELGDGYDCGNTDGRGYKIFVQPVTIIKKL